MTPTPSGVPVATTSPDREVQGIHVGHHQRAHRAERVEPLGARELLLLALDVPGGDVVQARVAEDAEARLGGAHAGERAADHDAELGLVMDLLRLLGAADRLLWAHHRRRGLHEDERDGGDLGPELLRVGPVVPPDADHLRGLHRREELHVGERDGLALRQAARPGCGGERAHGGPLDDAVGLAAGQAEAAGPHFAPLRPSTSAMSCSPAGFQPIHCAARIAPRANCSREVARWVSSSRSPSPQK